MIYLPVAAPDDADHMWYSVQVALPPEVEETIQRYIAEDEEHRAWTVEIHGALYGLRATLWPRQRLVDELQAALVAGQNSGPSIEVTPAFWKDLRSRAIERGQRINQLQAEGKLGNLLLPEELYAFMKEEIAKGRFTDPTAVVFAALPYLRSDETPQAATPISADLNTRP